MALLRALSVARRSSTSPCVGVIRDTFSARLGFARFSAAAGVSSVEAIKQLRERTGAPMMDCKKSLAANDWDLELAFQELRKRGLAAVGKKSGRVTAEGLVGIAKSGNGVAVVEVNCETDFVARNDQFQELVRKLASDVAASPEPLFTSVSAEQEVEFPAEKTEQDTEQVASMLEQVANVAVVVRENIAIRRASWLPTIAGDVAGTYVHKSLSSGVGSIAGAVVLRPDTPISDEHLPAVQELAQQLSMHCVAVNPSYLDKSSVDASELDKELTILKDQAAASGKPEKVIEKMVQGRLNKYYEQVCFVDQKFVMDDKKKVQAVINDVGKKAGCKLEMKTYLRVMCGEGIEKEVKDFSAEVAETVKGTA
mmetsp:Transcript_14004/g.16959  ORF Transcript_14004/g.16959 Transcript_14004/m.16959 type:complete len:367 (-) Transcript_14004:155-1255(-)|eukprot:CAMPEP_0197859586 /NCGR_PEP_ID=MMETSP1438-20131217/34255_1 /TAXON_ID=1461541 /ORGANISM="Pterosperma sp., Strain CCMP1384" /LENGTH=366 /DNA_ID=CAMNT_0043476125 /DNA_START=102 /DNA_END=1202 /DNA_ORIENTATION=-